MFPETRDAMRAFHHRAIHHLVNTSPPNFYPMREFDKNPFLKEYVDAIMKSIGVNSILTHGGATVNDHHYAAADGEAHEIILANLMRLYHEIPEEERGHLPDISEIMQRFVDDATVLRTAIPENRDLSSLPPRFEHWMTTPRKRNEQDWLVYVRTIAMLENDASPMFQNYRWIARNNLPIIARSYLMAERGFQPLTLEQVDEYYQKLKQRIEEHPPVRHVYEIAMLYEALYKVAPFRINMQNQMTHEERLAVASCYVEILKISVRRNENIGSSFTALYNQYKKNLAMLSNETTPPPDLRERNEQLLADALAMLETAAPEEYAKVKRMIDDDLEKRRAAITPASPKPWSEEIPLVSDDSGLNVISHPFILGNKLYYFFRPIDKMPPENRVRLDSIDLNTLQIRQGMLHPTNTGGSYGSFDDQFAYLIGRGPKIDKEIRVFPLDGSEPRTFKLTGFPGDTIDQICAFNGKLYVVLLGGDNGRIAWFVEINPKEKKWEILSSTSAREGKAPFFNVSPAPRFRSFVVDEPRNRLLFILDDSRPEWGGIWSMDGKTGTFTQHLHQQREMEFSDARMQIHDETGRVSISTHFYNKIIDLTNLSKPDDNNIEPVRPTMPEKFKGMGTIIPHPNGKDLIVGNGQNLVLLRFE